MTNGSQLAETPRRNLTFSPLALESLETLRDEDNNAVRVKDLNGKLSTVGGGFSCWKASDGTIAGEHHLNLVSPDFASDYLKKRLADAQILDRQPHVDDKGQTIGERIVAFFSTPTEAQKRGSDDPHVTVAFIIRLDGIHYSEDYSYSLDTALALEKYLDEIRIQKADVPPTIRRRN